MKFKIKQGETEHITFTGRRQRRSTMLIHLGERSISKKTFILGSVLVVCQILDGLLTYIGLRARGIHMEGNTFLRMLMHAYGEAPVLFFTKLIAISLVVILTLQAHRRRWIRGVILALIAIYVAFAVIPWVYIISLMVAHSIPS